jgi:hypothetical protein
VKKITVFWAVMLGHVIDISLEPVVYIFRIDEYSSTLKTEAAGSS